MPLVITEDGFIARAIASYRPLCPVIVLTDATSVARQLGLRWSLVPILVSDGQLVSIMSANSSFLFSIYQLSFYLFFSLIYLDILI